MTLISNLNYFNMFQNQFITKDIVYVGVNDRQKHKFENIFPLPEGVSYNSYLVLDDKVALVDTVDGCYGDLFIEKVKAAIGERKIDYLIVNHMEPDHSGSIRLLRQYFPDITIVGNARTLEMVNGYYGLIDNTQEVKEGDILELGKHKLQFFLTPMVHWPETMVTFDAVDQVLFAGDAFGCFGALNGAVLDTDMDVTPYWDEMVRYYACIVGKYGSPVQKALQKLSSVPLTTICSTHGPVWRQHLPKVVDTYDKMSRYEALEEGVVVAYGSMYGHTELMAEAVAQGLAQGGIRNIVVHNVSKTDSSCILRDVFKYKGLIIGSPTYNNNLHPGVDSLVRKIEFRGVKNKVFGCFGSFTWSGAAVRELLAFAESMKWQVAETTPEEKQGLKSDNYNACLRLGEHVAQAMR